MNECTVHWPDPHTHPQNIRSKAENALTEFQATHLFSPVDPPDSEGASSDKVLVFPIIQAGQFNIREEEQCLSLLFEHLRAQTLSSNLRPSMDLTSGYFGLYKPYQDLILQSSIDCRIIAASPMVCLCAEPYQQQKSLIRGL